MIDFPRKRLLLGSLLMLLSIISDLWSQEPNSFAQIKHGYAAQIRPLLETYCFGCHSTEQSEGDLDLEQLKTLAEVRRNPRTWQKVLFMLDNAEMPPKQSKQLSAEELTTLKAWVRAYLNAEAHAGAGDPGRVVVRRLSNAEYDNTIRDLTGIDFRPTREFPAASAAGEGFTNAGESMVMSPALFEKYLAAAQEVAKHAVLLPDGLRFSQVSARRDQTDEVIDKILAIYAEQTELVELRMTGGNRDGRIRWGQVPLTPYIQALIQQRAKLVKPEQVEAIAREAGLNPVYLGHLARLLRDNQRPDNQLSLLLTQLQGLLRKTTAADVGTVERETAAIMDWITKWQDQLLTLEDIGQLFTPGQQPLNPVQASQEFRLDLTPPRSADNFALALLAHDADGTAAGRAIWKNARLEHAAFGTISLQDLQPFFSLVSAFREQTLAQTSDYLVAVAEAETEVPSSVAALAKKHELNPDVLVAWAD